MQINTKVSLCGNHYLLRLCENVNILERLYGLIFIPYMVVQQNSRHYYGVMIIL